MIFSEISEYNEQESKVVNKRRRKQIAVKEELEQLRPK
jgi:hypothetical protein